MLLRDNEYVNNVRMAAGSWSL